MAAVDGAHQRDDGRDEGVQGHGGPQARVVGAHQTRDVQRRYCTGGYVLQIMHFEKHLERHNFPKVYLSVLPQST